MRTLVVTAADLEASAVLAGLGPARPLDVGPYRAADTGAAVVLAGGVGPAAAAAAAAAVLTADPTIDLLVSAGIAGAFPGARVDVGGAVVASEIVPADLGIETEEGFLDPTSLGFATAATACPAGLVATTAAAVTAAGLVCTVGRVLTLSTMTGTDVRAADLAQRHGALAEAMEGAGVAHVATRWDRPVLEVRTISNLVGRRDRGSWQIPLALDALTTAVAATLHALDAVATGRRP